MNVEEIFDKFCQESGFQMVYGMVVEVLIMCKFEVIVIFQVNFDLFKGFKGLYLFEKESMLVNFELCVIVFSFVLFVLIVGVGYGGVSVVNEIQQVCIVFVEQILVVLFDLDLLILVCEEESFFMVEVLGVFNLFVQDLDCLYCL